MSEWHEGVAAIFDTLLAPRTEYRELLLDGVLLRAKVSIISIVRFNRLIRRSEEHTSELQSLMRISYAVFCLKKKNDIFSFYTQRHRHKRTNRHIQIRHNNNNAAIP